MRRYGSLLSNVLPGAFTFAQRGFDLRVVEVGHRAQSESYGIGKLCEADDHHGLKNLLFGESIGSQVSQCHSAVVLDGCLLNLAQKFSSALSAIGILAWT